MEHYVGDYVVIDISNGFDKQKIEDAKNIFLDNLPGKIVDSTEEVEENFQKITIKKEIPFQGKYQKTGKEYEAYFLMEIEKNQIKLIVNISSDFDSNGKVRENLIQKIKDIF